MSYIEVKTLEIVKKRVQKTHYKSASNLQKNANVIHSQTIIIKELFVLLVQQIIVSGTHKRDIYKSQKHILCTYET